MEKKELKRILGFWDSVAINIGIVIGVGIFRVPAEVAKFLDSAPWILFAWFAGGLISLFGVICYAELSSRFPHTGGTYVYLREAYGRLAGFLYGWIEFLILRAGSLAGVAYIFSDYLRHFIPFGAAGEKTVPITAIAFFTAVNIAGLRLGAGVQNFLSVLKAAAILLISGTIFGMGSGGIFKEAALTAAAKTAPLAGLAPALIPILWSYGGWHESTFMSGEFKDTRRALPRSLVAGIFFIAALYITINAAYLKMMRPEEMIRSPAIAADIFQALFGPAGKTVITCVVLISACGALNSTILTGGRIPFAVGRDFPRFGWLSQVHARTETPLASYAANAIWASVLVIWGNFEQLLFFCGFAKWLEFTLVGLSIFFIRKKHTGEGAIPLRGMEAVAPIIFTLTSAWLCGTTIAYAPREALVGAFLILAGIPVYRCLNR